ncbi:hypothetical protein MKW92_028306 [Papaver armeniacum]|nr:hypothetical protein MKW92_028306 [Papaver armeniacum]
MELEETKTENVHKKEEQPAATQQSENIIFDQISTEINKNSNKDVDSNEMGSHKGNSQEDYKHDIQAFLITKFLNLEISQLRLSNVCSAILLSSNAILFPAGSL